jgi:hypothetical protein
VRPGPFRDFYQGSLAKGIKPTIACLTLARKIAAITLILWKKRRRLRPKKTKIASRLSVSGEQPLASLVIERSFVAARQMPPSVVEAEHTSGIYHIQRLWPRNWRHQELGGRGFPSTSGSVIEMATTHTRVAAIRKRIARKYRAGIISTKATGNRSTPRALKPQIMRAHRSPRLKESAQ